MAKYKPNPEQPKALTRQVTQRFLKTMDDIIQHHKIANGPHRSVKAFCSSIGANHTYFSQFGDEKFDRNVTLEMCAALCLVHHVQPTFILIGRGEKFTEEGLRIYNKTADQRAVTKKAKPTPKKAKSKPKAKDKPKAKGKSKNKKK